MSKIRLYNTLTNQKEELVPLVAGRIGMYVCGVTVYDHCHIGHARGAIVFDVIRRYLEYRGFTVTYVRNFTDVDDKIINRAKEEGCQTGQVAEKYTTEYCNDMEQLGVSPATIEPKATEHIKEIIELIQCLEKKGFAYQVEGDAFFEIAKFSDYGKLSNRDLESMRAGARIDIDSRKKGPLDFTLWKSAKEGEPAWESPWGAGRPGWHIECSAMSIKYLGDSFDIHGGGKDLIFPHHENEIAQSEACTGKPFARYWMHNGFVNINQEKMSKSLQNFFTIKEVLAKYPSEVLRLFLLSTHYRSPINFTITNMDDAAKALERFYNTFHTVEHILNTSGQEKVKHELNDLSSTLEHRITVLRCGFEKAMDDDFNTAEAIGKLYDAVKEVNVFIREHTAFNTFERNFIKGMVNYIKELGAVLGLFEQNEAKSEHVDDMTGDLMEILLEVRNICRNQKNWALADKIRFFLQEKGITIEDHQEGTTWRRK